MLRSLLAVSPCIEIRVEAETKNRRNLANAVYTLLVLFVLIRQSCTASGGGQWSCRVQESYVFFNVIAPLNTVINVELVTNYSIEYSAGDNGMRGTDCEWAVHEERKNVNVSCRLWKAEKTEKFAVKNLWLTCAKNYTDWYSCGPTVQTEYDYMYHCFDSHNVRDLQVTALGGNDIVVQWSASEWDEKYSQSLYSLAVRMRSASWHPEPTRVEDYHCQKCSKTLVAPFQCTNYEVCVESVYLADTKKTWSSCVATRSAGSCHAGLSSSEKAFIAGGVSVALLGVAALLFVLKFPRHLKRLRWVQPNQVVDETQVLPILEGDNMDDSYVGPRVSYEYEEVGDKPYDATVQPSEGGSSFHLTETGREDQ